MTGSAKQSRNGKALDCRVASLLAMTTCIAAFLSCAPSAWMAGLSPAMTPNRSAALATPQTPPARSFLSPCRGVRAPPMCGSDRPNFFRKRLPLSTYFAGLALAAYTDLLTFPSCVATKISVPYGAVSCHALLKAGSADFLADLRGTIFGDCVGRRQGAYQ